MLVYVDIIPTKKGFLNRLRGAATGFSPEVTKKTFLNCPYLSVGIHSASKRILKKQVDSVIPKTDRVVFSKGFPSELFKNYDFVEDCKELQAKFKGAAYRLAGHLPCRRRRAHSLLPGVCSDRQI